MVSVRINLPVPSHNRAGTPDSAATLLKPETALFQKSVRDLTMMYSCLLMYDGRSG